MRSRRARAVTRRGAPGQRCAPDAFAFGRSIRLAAIVRPPAMRSALLGGVWLGGIAMLAPDAVLAQQGPFLYTQPGRQQRRVLDTSTNTIVSPSR